MADDTVKRLLIKLGISTADWKTAVNDIKRQLDSVNTQAKADAVTMKRTQQDQLNITKQQVAEQQRLIAEAKTLTAVDQAKAQWQKQQQEVIKTHVQQRILETTELKKHAVEQQAALKFEQEQLRLAQMRYKLQQQERNEQIRLQRSQGSSSAFGGLGKIAGGLAGGGLMGSIVGGAFLGTGLERAMEVSVEKVRELVKALEEATGPAQQLRQVFENLSSQKGIDPTSFLEKLRQSTRGLVADTQLYTMANAFMRSGVKVSEDQMLRLITTTVNLGRATGRLPQAMHALERSFITGRMQMLGFAVGIDRASLTIKGLPASIDPATRKTIEFNNVLEQEEKMLKRVGVPAATLPELFTQIDVAEKNFIDGIAKGMLKSGAFGHTIDEISKNLTAMAPKLEEVAETIGEKLSDAVVFVKEHFDDLVTGAKSLLAIEFVVTMGKWAVAAKELAVGLGILKAAEIGAAEAGAVSGVAKGVTTGATAGVAGGLAGYIATLLPIVVPAVLAYLAGTWAGTGARENERPTERAKDQGRVITGYVRGMPVYGPAERRTPIYTEQELAKQAIIEGKAVERKPVHRTDTTSGKDTTDKGTVNLQEQQKLADLRLQIATAEHKEELESLKLMLEKEQEELKRSYNSGIIALQEYVGKQRALKRIQYEGELRQIRADAESQATRIKQHGEVSLGGVTYPTQSPEQQKLAQEKLGKQTQLKETTATLGFNKEDAALQDQLLNDQQNAYRKFVASQTKLAEEGVQQRIAILEKEFQGGRVNADKYLIDKRDLINQEFLVTRDGLKKQLEAAKGNATEQQTITDQIAQAKIKAEKELTLMTEGEYDIRLKASNNLFNAEKQMLQLAETQAQTKSKRGLGGSQIEIEEQLQTLTAKHISDLGQMRASLEQNGEVLQQNREQWIKISKEIQQSSTELTQIQEKLIQMKNISVPLGGIFGSLGGLVGEFPGRNASAISEMFGSMQKSSQQIGVFTGANRAVQQQNEATGEGPSNIFSQLGKNFKGLLDATKLLPDRMTAFGNSLSAVISGIQGMVTAGKGSASGGAGALKGGMAGMQAGSVAGPWGMLIGAVGGAVIGGMGGKEQKNLNRDIHTIETQLKSIVSDMNSGTLSMAQALQALRQERQQALTMLNSQSNQLSSKLLTAGKYGGNSGGKGGKGGGSKKGYNPTQIQAVIETIDSQIAQVVNIQTQTLQNLSSSLMQLSQPIQFQDYIQSLDTIIQKYQQFSSAAQGNAQEVTAANQYLNDSLQQYVTTLSQQLNQAQQTAINDALTLINLEYQRQQLINQEAQQEYDIMSQGVLTRQRTTAMTKGQEIGQLRYQRDMQLEQMNEEIALQQYKVSSEQKIFGLASTRIGLETQLLEAQQEQADYQIAQVQALAQIVAALQGGLATGQTMQQIESLMAGGTMPTGPGILYTLLQELGLSGNVPITAITGQYGTQNWLASIPPQFASAAQFVASLDPEFVQMIMSGQYSQAATAAQPYVSQGEVEGYDMTGFESWLQSGGTTNPIPGAASGGYTPGDGAIAVGEQGTEIFNPGTPGTILPSPIVSLLGALNGNLSPIGTPDQSTGLGVSKLDVESQLVNMTNYRVSLEMNIVQAKTTLLSQESDHLAALQQFYATLQSQGSSSSNLEAMLQKIYETRGRYGSGNFRRELL